MDVNLKRFIHHNQARWTVLLFCLMIIPGCGGESTPPTTANPVPPANAPTPAAEAVPSTAVSASNKMPEGVTIDEAGKKKLDDIPYDIWFEKPLSLIKPTDMESPQSASSPAASTASMAVAPNERAPANSTVPAVAEESTNDGEWDELVTPAILEEEVTRISISLTSYLNQLASFNRSRNEIAEEAEALIAAALVASRLNADLRWKNQTLVLADCGERLVKQSKESGRASFNAAQIPLQQVRSVLNGETVNLEAEPDANSDFSDRVDRGAIMYRMESAFEWLATNIDAANKLETEQKTAERETAILAMLGKIIGEPGYPYAEEAGYHEEAAGFVTSSLEMKSAVLNKDFDQFVTKRDRLEKHCADCHANYRFE
ncbi:MAG: hypothetical protein CMJ46_16265 [Planctomyces sp.]|nr:hypothetical protein [Planctomyces sp.]